MTKTVNQLRAEIIKKAKGFVEEHGANFDFIIKANRIVARNLNIWKYGHSICKPSDVFNEHIGKAISLGRALRFDVSEFTSAVQPTEVVVGHITTFGKVHAVNPTHRTVGKDVGIAFIIGDGGFTVYKNPCEIWYPTCWAEIVDDTEAQYE